MAKKGLTPKQKRFIDEYLVDLNATQAYFRAGYSAKSENVAAATAIKLLRNAKISEELAIRFQERKKRTEVTQDMVIRELQRIAFSDPRDAMKWGKNGAFLKDSRDLTDDEAAAIAEVTETQSGLKIKRYDKLRALELLAKHLGMLEQRELAAKQESNLFEVMVASAKGELDTDDLSEVEQETAVDDDLVEPTMV